MRAGGVLVWWRVRFDPDKTTAAMDRMQQATNACDLPKPAEHPAG